MPKPKAAFARGFVVTTDCSRRQRRQAFRIPNSEHYIFHLQRILQLLHNIEDVLSPLLLSAKSQPILTVGQDAQLALIRLKIQLDGELDNAGIDRCGRDNSKRGR